MNYKGYKIQKVYTIISKDAKGYDYQFTLRDAKRIIDKRIRESSGKVE